MALRFRHSGDNSEDWGYVSLRMKATGTLGASATDHSQEIQENIEQANLAVRQQLKKAIGGLTWQDFESNFLPIVLEALGSNEVKITQPTRDGGRDAICSYRRGIISSEAIVSAKHWKAARVGGREVRDLRGQKGIADTGVIITSSFFTKDAEREAEPSQNQRTIVLVDGSTGRCLLKNNLGVKEVALPALYTFIGFEENS